MKYLFFVCLLVFSILLLQMSNVEESESPFVISECTWSSLDDNLQRFLVAAGEWASPGPERSAGWRHNRPNPNTDVKIKKEIPKLKSLVLLFNCAKWKVENGLTRCKFKGMNYLKHPTTDAATADELESLTPAPPLPRWNVENSRLFTQRADEMKSATENDWSRITKIDREANRELEIQQQQEAKEAERFAEKQTIAKEAAEKRRAERMLRLAQIRERERAVNESLRYPSDQLMLTPTPPTEGKQIIS